MGELTPGLAPVTDRTTPPRGVLPKHVQTWLMAGLAVGLLLIIVMTGRPEPSQRPTPPATPQAAAPNPDRLRDYQDRLRLLDERARQQVIDQPAATPPFVPPPEVGVRAAPDPLEAEKKRRDYESLFASTVAVSRRPAGQRPAASAGRSTGAAAADQGALRAEPSLDDIADAVLRAGTSPPVAADATTAPVSADAASDVTTGPTRAGSATGAHQRPPRTVTRGPIDDAGPLHPVLEGTVLDGVLTNRLDGHAASPVNVLVTNALYSHSGQHVLVPAGARVLGETKPVQALGESRLAVAFHRLLMPDGRTYSLDQFAGLNARGDSGLHDQVDQHYRSTFGAAGAVGLLSGLSQLFGTAGISRGSGDRTIVLAGSAGDATAQAIAPVLTRFLNRLPTITIREGHRVKVYVTSDFDLPAYDAGTMRHP